MNTIHVDDPLVFALPGNESVAVGIVDALEAEFGIAEIRDFPDGESYVRMISNPRDREVVLVGTLHPPNDRFMRIAFLADVARELGARRVGLVAPYLAYLRQDRRFHTGEAVTSRTFGRLVSRAVDWVVSVDPHLHRLTSLAEVYDVPAIATDAAPLLGDWVKRYVENPLIVGPDAESEQWALVVAEVADVPLVLLKKQRLADEDVHLTLPRVTHGTDRVPVLVDDIVSTGRTLVVATQLLRSAGFPAPVCVVVHAVFADGALERILGAGTARIVTTNSIVHSTNAIDVVPAIATAFDSSRRSSGGTGRSHRGP